MKFFIILYNLYIFIRRAQWCGDMPLNVVRNFPCNEVRNEYPQQKPLETDEKEQRPIPPVRTRPNQLLSEKRLEHLRSKNENNVDVGELSLPECIKVIDYICTDLKQLTISLPMKKSLEKRHLLLEFVVNC